MHIALFTDFHPATLGGVQTAMRALVTGLRRDGHRVTVFCPPAPEPVPEDPDTVLLRPIPLATLAGGLPMVLPTRTNRFTIDAHFATRGPVDIVHALTTYGCGILGARAARRHGVPVVQTMQSRDDTVIEKYAPSPLSAALTMRLLHGWFVPLRGKTVDAGDDRVARLAWRPLIAQAGAADHVTVPTRHFARRLAARGVDRPIHVVSNGIDDALLDKVLGPESATGPAASGPEPAASGRPDPAAVGHESGHGTAASPVAAGPGERAPLRVLWCGRLSPEKRPVEAIEVARRVADCTLDIYGGGRLADEVREAISAAELDDRVRSHGEVDQAAVLRAMCEHDVLLLTSDSPSVFRVSSFLVGFFAAGGLFQLTVVVLAEFFPARKGLVTSLIGLASGVAAFVLPFLTGVILGDAEGAALVGPYRTVVWLGIAVAVISALLGVLVNIRHRIVFGHDVADAASPDLVAAG